MVHDNIIKGYDVDFENETLVIKTEYNITRPKVVHEETDIVFRGYLTHTFYLPMKNSVIFDTYELSIGQFLKNEREVLMLGKNSCWPIHYENIEELSCFLHNNSYMVFIVGSSYGLNGWVIAKSMEIVTESLIT